MARQTGLRAAMLNEITGDPAWQATFVFYMGYPKVTAHASPRRPVRPYSYDGPNPRTVLELRRSRGTPPSKLAICRCSRACDGVLEVTLYFRITDYRE